MSETRPTIVFAENNDPSAVLALGGDIYGNNVLVVWKNRGAYRIFPPAVIRNSLIAVQTVQDQARFCPRNTGMAVEIAPRVRWAQGLDISPQVAELLCDLSPA